MQANPAVEQMNKMARVHMSRDVMDYRSWRKSTGVECVARIL